MNDQNYCGICGYIPRAHDDQHFITNANGELVTIAAYCGEKKAMAEKCSCGAGVCFGVKRGPEADDGIFCSHFPELAVKHFTCGTLIGKACVKGLVLSQEVVDATINSSDFIFKPLDLSPEARLDDAEHDVERLHEESKEHYFRAVKAEARIKELEEELKHYQQYPAPNAKYGLNHMIRRVMRLDIDLVKEKRATKKAQAGIKELEENLKETENERVRLSCAFVDLERIQKAERRALLQRNDRIKQLESLLALEADVDKITEFARDSCPLTDCRALEVALKSIDLEVALAASKLRYDWVAFEASLPSMAFKMDGRVVTFYAEDNESIEVLSRMKRRDGVAGARIRELEAQSDRIESHLRAALIESPAKFDKIFFNNILDLFA